MSNIDWSKKQRQAPIGLLLFAVQTLRKILKGAWPILLLFIIKDGDNKNELYFWLTIAGTLFILINGSLSYWYFRFNIEGDEFVIRKGYLKKIKLAVAIDRIQTVNIKQNIFQRVLGVVTVEIDTAGAKNAEIELIAIKKELASEFERKFGQIRTNSSVNNEINSDNIKNTQQAVNKPIITLSVEDLLKVGISQNHLRNLMVVVAFVYSFYYQLGNRFQSQIEEYAEKGIENVAQLGTSILITFVVMLFIFALVASIIKMIIKYYNFRMLHDDSNYIISYGLLNIKKINIPLRKIQLIIYEDNPIKKFLGFKSLTLYQASAANNVKKDQKINIPACSSEQQKIIEEDLYNNNEEFSKAVKTHGWFFIKNFILFTLILSPIVLLLLLGDKLLDIRFFIPLVSIELILAGLLFLDYRKRNFRLNEDIIEINKGQIGNTYKRMYMYKIQSVSIKQSIFMKRRNLATIVLYTAAGTQIIIPYIESKTAYNTANYILFKIESSKDAWM